MQSRLNKSRSRELLGRFIVSGKFICRAYMFAGLLVECATAFASDAPALHQARIKDIASIEGIRDNQLVGYGIVVGLQGTGDSQQTQTIMLRGLVRPEDISQQNQVLSTAISSLELEVRGKGIITDYTHRPNVLVRLLQRVLIF